MVDDRVLMEGQDPFPDQFDNEFRDNDEQRFDDREFRDDRKRVRRNEDDRFSDSRSQRSSEHWHDDRKRRRHGQNDNDQDLSPISQDGDDILDGRGGRRSRHASYDRVSDASSYERVSDATSYDRISEGSFHHRGNQFTDDGGFDGRRRHTPGIEDIDSPENMHERFIGGLCV